MADRDYKRKTVFPAKIPQSKRYEYLKKVEDGVPRVRAYAETIDPLIYDIEPEAVHSRLDYLKEAWKDYDELVEMIRAERADWNLKRSAAAQEKAMELLTATLDRAIDLVKDPNSDVKQLGAAIQTLKTIMPAFTKKEEPVAETRSVKMNASKYIN